MNPTNPNQSDLLATESIGKLLFRLSVPAVAAQLINMLYNIVDRIYIGHMPGDGALALTGLGVCLPIILIVSAFASLVSMGGAPRASIALGRGDHEAAERTLGNCFLLQICVSVILTILMLLWNEPFLFAFGASANTIGYATDYMNIYAIGTIFVQLTLGMNAFITAQGFAKTGMLTVLIGAICNIILDPILIFGFHMGVKGAALATIISQAVSAIWVVHFLLSQKTYVKLRKKYVRLQAKIILPCMALGLAPFIMQSSESILSLCFNSSLLHYGGDIAVGAMTILASVTQFAMLPMQGLAQGAQPISSFNYGAKNTARVKQTFLILLRSSLIYSILLWGLVMLFPQMFARMFASDVALLEFTTKVLPVYCFGMFVFGAQTACQMTFISLGKAGSSIIVAIVRKFILLIPLIYILPHFIQNKTMAVYLAEPVADIIAVTFTVCLFAVTFRKALRALDKPEAES
ncbi:MAG: MATE family efflux transporter [Evtepia sp.]